MHLTGNFFSWPSNKTRVVGFRVCREGGWSHKIVRGGNHKTVYRSGRSCLQGSQLSRDTESLSGHVWPSMNSDRYILIWLCTYISHLNFQLSRQNTFNFTFMLRKTYWKMQSILLAKTSINAGFPIWWLIKPTLSVQQGAKLPTHVA